MSETIDPDQPDTLHPGWPVVVNSLAVIIVSIPLASLCSVGLLVADPYSFLMASAQLALVLTVGVLQYAACFRGSRRAAKALFYFHAVGIFAFLANGGICLALAFGAPHMDMEPQVLIVSAIFLTLSVLAGWSTWTILIWSNKLEAANLAAPEELFRPPRPFQVSIRELLLAMTVVALIAGLAAWMMQAWS